MQLHSMNTIQELINEFKVLEGISRDTFERCYKAREKLERLYAPAPSGVRKVLSEEKKASLVVKFRKSTLKKKAI